MTYDRYLLRSFFYTCLVCFITTFGLFIVIDLFENIDEMFQINGNRGIAGLFGLIIKLYGYRSILFFDRGGPALVVISVMTLLILLQRSGELHSLLAAGIPMYRILRPLIVASIVFNCVWMINQEFFVPRVASLEHELRHRHNPSKTSVQPLIDHTTLISIDGNRINVPKRKIENPVFVLPTPTLVNDIEVLEAKSAVYLPARNSHPSGWLLKDVTAPPLADISRTLTDRGRELIQVQKNARDVFVVSAVTCDQLLNRNSSFTSLSTPELLARIRCPAYGKTSVHRLVCYLHSRFMQPVINVIAVLLAIPLMVRRQSGGLVFDSSLCGMLMAVLFGLVHGFDSLGASELIPPELAAWAPVVIGGSLSAWISGVIRT